MSGGRRYLDEVTLGDVPDRVDIEPGGSGSIRYVGVRTYLPDTVDPVVPAPVSGDRYYNTAAKEWRWFDGAVWIAYGSSGAVGASPLILGANSVSATTTIRYLYPGYSSNLAQTTLAQFPVPRAGTLMNLFILHNAPAGNGNAIVYTVRKNGVATALAVTLASTGSLGSDLANSVAVVAGDLIDIEVTKALGIGSTPNHVVAMMELV